MRRAPATFAALTIAYASTACGRLDEWPDELAVEAPIVDGTRETGEPAVVALMGVTGLCTGTLIAPTVVLTAKHCVVPERAAGPIAPGLVTVGIGDRVFGASRSLRVREIVTTPGPLRISSGLDPVNTATGTDIALLVLRDRVDDVAPIPVRRASAEDLVSAPAVAIGFGNTRAGTSGVKNRQDTTITAVTPNLLEAIETICQGDSGGPLLVEREGVREVAGVASFGVYRSGGAVGSCPSDADYWNRVDVQMELIDLALLRAGECPPSDPPREEVCNSLDDDCDGETDEGCLALGAICTSDDQCAFGPMPEGAAASNDPEPVRCTDVGGGERRCAIGCDATITGGCDVLTRPLGLPRLELEGFFCSSLGGCEGTCVPGEPGGGINGATCERDTDCASLRCVDVGGSRLCVTPCTAGAGACPLGEVCSATEGATGDAACGFCVGASSLPTGRALGEVCDDAGQCASGTCALVDGLGETRVCTLACDNDANCPTRGFRCEGGSCVPGPRGETLDPCRAEADCIRSADCVGEPGATYCATTCSTDLDCVAGARCDTSQSPPRCAATLAPVGGACGADAECVSGACRDGRCALPCDPRTPCPPGLVCTRTAEGTYCAPPPAPMPPPASAGCTVAGRVRRSGVTIPALLALLAGLAGVSRRRRASCGDRPDFGQR